MTPLNGALRPLALGVAGLAITAALFAGCGGDDSTRTATSAPPKSGATTNAGGAPAATTVDPQGPCSLLTQDDVTSALGDEQFDNHSSTNQACIFIGRKGDAYDTVQLVVSQQRKETFETVKKTAKSPKDISGVGEEAYLVQGSNEVGQLFIYKNGNAVILSLSTGGVSTEAAKTPFATRSTALEKIGKAVGDRLR